MWKQPLLRLGYPGVLAVNVIARTVCWGFGHRWEDLPGFRFCRRCWEPRFEA